MVKKFPRTLLAALLAVMLLASAACGTTTDTTADATDTAAATTTEATESADDVDRDVVIAEVGTYTVTYGELADYYDYYVELLSYYGYSAPTDETEIEELQDTLLADYVNNLKQYYFADQYGIELDEADLAEVQASTDEEFNYYLEDFTAQAEEEGLTDEQEIHDRAMELFGEDLVAYGIDMSASEYYDYIYDEIKDEKRIEKLETYLSGQVTITEDDVQAYYDSLVEDQQETYGTNPEYYLDDEQSYEIYGGDPGVVVPEGYLRVKVIVVKPEEAIDDGYDDKLAEMEEYEAEYGALALADETANAARLKEIRTMYAALKLEADQMYEAYVSTARAKAQEAYGKLEAGEAFDDVLTAYGSDADYAAYETVMAKGKLLYGAGEDSAWPDAVREAATALTAGSYSEIILADDAYYIVYLVGEEPAGTVALDDVHDVIYERALLSAQDANYDNITAEWDADDSMVVYHEELFRSIGK